MAQKGTFAKSGKRTDFQAGGEASLVVSADLKERADAGKAGSAKPECLAGCGAAVWSGSR